MRIRSAARSNSCLHLSEQKKYLRFLYSLLGDSLPLSTRIPQIGSYDWPRTLSLEFTALPPPPQRPFRRTALPTTQTLACNPDAGLALERAALAVCDPFPR